MRIVGWGDAQNEPSPKRKFEDWAIQLTGSHLLSQGSTAAKSCTYAGLSRFMTRPSLMAGFLYPVFDLFPFRISELSEKYDEAIHHVPKTKTPKGTKHNLAALDFSRIKTVSPKNAKAQAKHKGEKSFFSLTSDVFVVGPDNTVLP
jgi:hypothetical protein